MENKMKRYTLFILSILIAASMVLAACQPAVEQPVVEEPVVEEVVVEEPVTEEPVVEEPVVEEPEEQVVEEPEVKEDIIIGMIQDLSGPGSVFGNACVKGAELAIEQINAAGGVDGRMMRLIPYDIRGATEEAITAYIRLADVDNANVVLGPPLSNVGLALIPVTNEKNIPILGLFGHPSVMVNEDGTTNRYMFLAQPSSSYSGLSMASYDMNVRGVTNVAVIARQDHSFLMTFLEGYKNYVESNGGTITTEQFVRADDTDFKVQLNIMNQTNPDSIFSAMTTQEQVILVTQAHQLGIDVSMSGSGDFSLPFVDLLHDSQIADEIYFPNSLYEADPEIQDVREAYLAKFNEEPTRMSYMAYDQITMVVEAIRQADYRVDPESIRDSLENNIKDLKINQGVISLDPETHMPIGLAMWIYKIENGEYVMLERHLPVVD
jgi:branched-chain amino acid transport system substrate-binding protein